MKKILLFFAAAACAVASWAADVVTATITDKQLTVNLENETLFCAFQMDIALPAGVGVEDVTLNVNRLDEGTTTIAGAANGNFTIAYNVLPDNTLRVIAYNLANRELKLSEGALFTVTLDQATDAELNITNILFVDKDQLEEHRLENAAVEEGATFKPGDVTGEGVVNIDDVQAVIDLVFGRTDGVAEGWNLEAADPVKGAGAKYTIDDVTAIIDIMFGR